MGEARRRRLIGEYPTSRMRDPHVERVNHVRFYSHDKAVVSFRTSAGVFKLLQIRFLKDGSITVQWPYFQRSNGALRTVEFERTLTPPTMVPIDDFVSTSHLVKFSHHPDGRVHFSQDRKIYTVVKRSSYPLGSSIGRIFDMECFDLSGFQRVDKTEHLNDRANIEFVGDGSLPSALGIIAEWRRLEHVEDNMQTRAATLGPWVRIQSRRTGAYHRVVLLGQPAGFPFRDHILVIECYPLVNSRRINSPAIFFRGGWDCHEVPVPGQPASHTGYLMAVYPKEMLEIESARFPSIDFPAGVCDR